MGEGVQDNVSDRETPKLFVGFSEISEEQFYEVYEALPEGDRKRMCWLFFSMFCQAMDTQSSIMDDLLEEAKANPVAAVHTIKYGVRFSDGTNALRDSVIETAELWRKANGGS